MLRGVARLTQSSTVLHSVEIKRKDACIHNHHVLLICVHVIISMQVIQMQCSVEPVEEGAKYHVSCIGVKMWNSVFLAKSNRNVIDVALLSFLLADFTAEAGG